MRRRYLRLSLATVVSLACLVHSALADHTYYDIDHPPNPLNYSRKSAPEPSDSVFVEDTSLESQCYFSTSSPLLINLEVDRHVGDAKLMMAENIALISKEAILKLHVFDVEGTSFGEFHKVYFNDLLLTRLPDGTPTGIEGSNCWWTTVHYRVPVDTVEFATLNSSGPPTKGQNEIRIELDTNSSTPTWCMTVDWIALEIRAARPVVLVHGILTDGAAWNGVWHNGLTQVSGLPQTNDLNMGPMDWMEANAFKIASAVSDFKARTGSSKVSLVTQSKGGLDARLYSAFKNDVENIVQIGTPNAGSPIADIVLGLLMFGLGPAESLHLSATAMPALIQLTTPYATIYNSILGGAKPGVSYTAIAGDYDPEGKPWWDALYRWTFGPGDTVVPVWSVHSLNFPTELTVAGKRTDPEGQLVHHVSQYVAPQIRGAALAARSFGTLDGGGEHVLEHLPRSAAKDSIIAEGDSVSWAIAIDDTSGVVFMLLYPSGNLDLSLRSPSGQFYNLESTSADPNAIWSDDALLASRVESARLGSIEVGIWTATIHALDVEEAADTCAFALQAWFLEPAILLEPVLPAPSRASGEAIEIRATLTNAGSPLPGASVRALVEMPDGDTTSVWLLDSGVYPDSASSDGVHTGNLTSTTEDGLYPIRLIAEGGGSGGVPKFTREALGLASVSASTTQPTGTVSSSPADTNGNSLFDHLAMNVSLNVTASATYIARGVLTDGQGNSQNAYAKVDLSTGSQQIPLVFDGSTIYWNGIDGPYSLAEFYLSEVTEQGVVPVGTWFNLHQTGAFDHDQFEHPPIRLSGQNSSIGVDSDTQHPGYESLEVSIGVEFDETDFMTWSGRLYDSEGRQIGGLSEGRGLRSAGTSTITLTFGGLCIRRNGVDGPFHVKDLVIASSSHTLFAREAVETNSHSAVDFASYYSFQLADHMSSDSLVVCPFGDADALELALYMNHDCNLDSVAAPPQVQAIETFNGTVLWDARVPAYPWDAHNDTLDAYRFGIGAMTDTAYFRTSAISGCHYPYPTWQSGLMQFILAVDGGAWGVSQTAYLKSMELDTLVSGSVDRFDMNRYNQIKTYTNNQFSCNNYNWDGVVNAADSVLFWAHYDTHHHVPRQVMWPTGGQRYAPQESFYVTWLPGAGDSARVTIRLTRDSDPSWQNVFVSNMRDTTGGSYSGQMPTAELLANGTDYRFEVIHTAGYWLSGTVDIGRDNSEQIEIYGVGCPYVETWDGTDWRPENSILARSVESALSQDAYLIKSEPDRSSGRLRFRILENADEFTTLDRVAVAALDVAEGSRVLRVGDRYVAGTWEPATRVAKVSGEEITHLTDGSRAEYYLGSPGDTLLVDLPPRRAPAGVEGQDGFSTAQGGGGSGGSGGGKGIDPAPDGPLTTAGAAVDERYLNETGILVQFRNGNGDWETAQHWYPREHLDDFVVDGFTEGQMRLIFLDKHKLRYLGRFNYSQDGVAPKTARLLSASHTRLGDQLSAVQGADESATIIAPGDTVTFEFETVPPEAGKARHWFLVTNGVYSSAAPQGYLDEPAQAPAPTYAFALGAARPNPTSGNVQIDYSLARESNVSLRIYNVAGRLVRDLVGERQKAGPYNLTWNLRDNGGARVSSGVYFYRLVADEWTSQRKVVFIER